MQKQPTEAEKKKVLGAFRVFIEFGEKALLRDVEEGRASLSDKPFVALAALATYTKLVAESDNQGNAPERIDISEGEMLPIMQLILVIPGWEPDARWPFTKKQMAMAVRHYEKTKYIAQEAGLGDV